MVNIEIECEDGYDAKRFERGDTLRYYMKGPAAVSNPKGEIGMFDLKGRYAGKFKSAEGAKVQQRITLGMCLNNATSLIAAQTDAENQPQNMVQQIFDLTDELYAEYNQRYNS